MLILALDSAMNGCSVGLHDFSRDIHISEKLEISRGQAEALIPMLQRVMNSAEKSMNDIDMVAVTQGPGAFTGLRVAMASAKSLALALKIPVIGVCTFDAVLHTFLDKNTLQNKENENVAVILETKRDDLYFCVYDFNAIPCSPKMTLMPENIISIICEKNSIVIGDACDRLISESKQTGDTIICKDIQYPETKSIAFLAGNKKKKSTDTCDPVYIRLPDAIQPKQMKTIK